MLGSGLAYVAEDRDGSLSAEHHPFTRPCTPEELLADPASAQAAAYDVVLCYELGGGSLRIHDNEMQKQSLTFCVWMRLVNKFSSCWTPCGTVPLYGGAPGLDRLVMLMTNTLAIRDVTSPNPAPPAS